jgi:hypothetical protein
MHTTFWYKNKNLSNYLEELSVDGVINLNECDKN